MKSEKSDWKKIFKRILKAPATGWRSLAEWVGRSRMRFRNWRLRKSQIDFVVVRLSGSFPERPAPPRSFLERQLPLPPPSMSVQGFNNLVQRLIDADNVHGVVFHLENVSVGLARLQTLRDGLQRLRTAGKRVVVYTSQLGNGSYYLASAADQIAMPPAANWMVFGLYNELVFLRDALAYLGISFENIQISPYKSAFNNFSEADITPEQREQLNWLLNDQFEQLVSGMAAGRNLSPEAVRALVDQAPLTAEQAQAAGLVDFVAYEDELPRLLADGLPPLLTKTPSEPEEGSETERVAELKTWDEAHKKLRGRYRRRHRGQHIAVVSLEGTIIDGQSQSPPIDLPIPFIGGQLAGDVTLVRLLRQVEDDEETAALVFHVDSRGGSALASDLIGREIERLSRKLPIVVYMGDVAASGGYYVSAFAKEIVCQPGTITGSIGVVSARPTTDGLYEKLHLNRVALQRGARAALFTDHGTLAPEERQVLFDQIVHAYGQFKQVVAAGRGLPIESLDPICEGRVWTGRQALAHRLIDRHGGFLEAVAQAKALAELPTGPDVRVAVMDVYPEKGSRPLPRPFDPTPAPADVLTMWPKLLERVRLLSGSLYLLPVELKQKLD